MSRLFISHSSANDAQAAALAQWLKDQGFGDYFLDLDPERGIAAGERWLQAFMQALGRCEAVVFLLSPAWTQSRYCKSEFDAAKGHGKRLFGVVVEPLPLASVSELAADWQLCDLTVAARDADALEFPIALALPSGAGTVRLSRSGLDRLARGLRRAGLDPHTFQWPPRDDPKRSPYPGLRALDREDAAVFFGRDTAIVRSLDRIRLIRERRSEHLFVILGASGAGKSSFLRAGLLPRLERDVDRFIVLPTIRPEASVITGPRGLLVALKQALAEAGEPASLAQLRAAEGRAGAAGLIERLAGLGRPRMREDEAPPAPRTVVLPIDQAEELFAPDGQPEFERFLELLRAWRERALQGLSHEGGFVVLLTMRSDALPLLQACAPMQALAPVLESLEPMAATEYKSVIEGPAKRHSEGGPALAIEPQLAEQLVKDAQGADALPLLALTLEWLYREFEGAQDGLQRSGGLRIGLAAYEQLGGVRGVIGSAVARALESPAREPAIPAEPAALDAALHRLFPLLATVDPDSGKAQRLVARQADVDRVAHGPALVQRLVEQRLLVQDRRVVGEQADAGVVEVAHEALLRQWDRFERWLADAQASLVAIEVVRRAAADWQRGAHDEALLVHGTSRLRQAEALRRDERLGPRFSADEEDYLAACRAREQRLSDEREAQQREREAHLRVIEQGQRERAEEQRKTARTQSRLYAGLALILLAAVALAAFAAMQAREAWRQTSLVLAGASETAADEGQFPQAVRLAYLATDQGSVPWLRPRHAAALPALSRAAAGLASQMAVAHGDAVWNAQFSPDGRTLVTASADNTARLWDAETGSPVGEEMRHEGTVASARFSPDGQRVVTASFDTTARLWDARSGKPVGAPLRHQHRVSSAEFSADGRRVVTASEDGTARLWDAETAAPLGEAMRHLSVVRHAHFSRDGLRVVTAAADKTARVWHGLTGKPLGEPLRHEDAVSGAQFSPDGRRVVTTSDDHSARLWDTATGKPLGPALRHEGAVLSAQFSPDGRRVVTASGDKTARIWDATTGKPVGDVLRHDNGIGSAQFSPDGQRVVTASFDRTARVWDATTGDLLGSLPHESYVSSARFSPDGLRVVTASGDKTARIWAPEFVKPRSDAERFGGGEATYSQFSPDGRWVVTLSDDGAAVVLDTQTGKPLGHALRHGDKKVSSAQFSADGTRVVTVSDDKTARLWDTATGKPLGEALRHQDSVLGARFSPDGQRVVTASGDKAARVWDAATGKPLGVAMRHEGPVASAQFSRDGRRVVTASWDKTARVWDAETGKPMGEALRHESAVWTAQFSPDGRRVVTTSEGNTARIWDAQTGKRLGETAALEDEISGAQISPDGRRLVTTASMDDFARLWDAETGKPVGEAMRHESAVLHAQFSLDGRRVVTTSFDNTARIWDTETGKPLSGPLRHAGAVLSAQFSLDGRRVITASEGNTTRIWDISTSTLTSRDELLALACKRIRGPLRIINAADAARAKVIDAKDIDRRDICPGLTD
ncbi:MAG: TIR domain-containing protein [Rubrivivax sp.]|nr:TIR domain-containing protein [Rubrivivax sp.]